MFMFCEILVAILVITINWRIPPRIVSLATNDDVASETQHATCKIATQETQTSANASITRQLKGVCTARQLNFKLKQLEMRILEKLRAIMEFLEGAQLKPSENLTESTDYEEYQDLFVETETIQQHKDRQPEIKKNNNTINERNEFFYYWKIDKIEDILRKKGIYIKSPDFSVLGHKLNLQVFPNHLDSDYLGIQLKSLSKFFTKYKISILDRFERSKDIKSHLLIGDISNFGSVYRIPNEKLSERNYIFENSMIINVIVYIGS